MTLEVLNGYGRHDIIKLLKTKSKIRGIELGVAAGSFSKEMIKTNRFEYYIGVDIYYDRGHDINEYREALKKNGLFSNFHLLRMYFSEALELFEDESFDFIYVDGYAHTGEEEGKTLYDWYPKLKRGGLFAGDDYSSKWPKVVKHVDKFVNEKNVKMYLTDTNKIVKGVTYSKSPSWAIIKD